MNLQEPYSDQRQDLIKNHSSKRDRKDPDLITCQQYRIQSDQIMELKPNSQRTNLLQNLDHQNDDISKNKERWRHKWRFIGIGCKFYSRSKVELDYHGIDQDLQVKVEREDDG